MDSMNEKAMAECLGVLFENELAAIHAYDEAIEKFTGEDEDSSLRDMREEHRVACEELESRLHGLNLMRNASFARESGWGKLVAGAGKLLSEKELLRALKSGEEEALGIYQAASYLRADDQSFGDQVENVFLPTQQRHIDRINTMIDMQE